MLHSNKNKIVCLFLLAVILLCIYLLRQKYLPEDAAPTLVSYAQNLQDIEKKLNTLEKQLHQKERTLPETYTRLLQTHGRLICKTIVCGNPSRLNLADVTLRSGNKGRDNEASVSRSYIRYSSEDFNIMTPSAATAYELDAAFRHTALAGAGKAFIAAELETGINAMFLAAMAAHESNWGASQLAREYNNLFGFGAYDSNPAGAASFSSQGDCILHVARFLRDHYIEGTYYRGHAISDINKLYASDPTWSIKIFATMQKLDDSIRAQQIEP